MEEAEDCRDEPPFAAIFRASQKKCTLRFPAGQAACESLVRDARGQVLS